MYDSIVVPVDGSRASWTAAGPARDLARRWESDFEVISVVHYGQQVREVRDELDDLVGAAGWRDDTMVTVREAGSHSVTDVIADHVSEQYGSLVAMSSAGRGRSAAIFGSVAEGLLRKLFGPVLVFGPAVSHDRLDLTGALLLTADGSSTSEAAFGVAGAWAVGLEMTPWVMSVGDAVTAKVGGEILIETAYPHRMADRLSAATGLEVEFETLHGDDPARAIVDFAQVHEAGLIVAATHGRTGLRRLAAGSVAMSIVHRAPCPVLLVRPPHLSEP
ncbi:MAG: universal stress protein [Acidimicrobiales bacterium]